LDENRQVVESEPLQAAPPPPPKPRKSLAQELLETLLLTLILFGVAKFSLQNFKVQGTSMVPTLQDGEFILVDKISYRFHLPSHGDIVVFKFPQDTTRDFIKRVIGVPGDTVSIKPVNGVNHVFVNGKELYEPYISAEPDSTSMTFENCVDPKGCSYHVKPDELFVMGDNRNFSYDSRAWGPMPMKDMIGHALISYWPLPRLAFLPSQYSYATTHK
jgi:signal peptidase I